MLSRSLMLPWTRSHKCDQTSVPSKTAWDHTISNLMNIAEKTADSRSRLEDADFALESARLAKNQVLQQAGTSMLSQANQMSQLVMELLRG